MDVPVATSTVVLGSVAFAVFWVLAVFPVFPLIPIGRTAGSLLSAMLMVLFGVMTPDNAYAAIKLPILTLLFSTMVISAYLERADLFAHLCRLLTFKSKGPKDLIIRISLVSAATSALFTNDTCCVVLTGFILKLARQNNLPAEPFLLALASSANIGSAASPIGNPQNLIIATQSQISFRQFVHSLLPAVLVGVFLNVGILILLYWNQLSVAEDVETNTTAEEYILAGEEVASHRFSPVTMSHLSSMDSAEWIGAELDSSSRNLSVNESTLRNRSAVAGAGTDQSLEETSDAAMNPDPAAVSTNGIMRWARRATAKWKVLYMWTAYVYLVHIGMFAALLVGLNMSWTALTAALALVVVDFRNAQHCLEKVSYSLLIFFCGMFITVEGFNRTRLPDALWKAMEFFAPVDQPIGIAVLSGVVLLLSNIASNVPTVLLLSAYLTPRMGKSKETRVWLVLSWVSTVAGNMTLLGSAANLIVIEQAKRAPSHGYNLSYSAHLRFGFLSTLVVTGVVMLVTD